ncbi:bifunctional oligoribonuclease/PAP phosphatase NrnA [Tuanshanicoccus lijuaniae]|uniref:DHH family phosphoesterase n=1 Tax=Aerococcaceae bacterium zg-1292 TaxID=2774330 RepID=UPI0019368449|nr:bifunctional oligoribonuclease/PAP phosphatase NrnA [Aerococcaceae bacterium zg-1292]MBS4455468.1 bifunctional oligoribonuclease/PAP phosphatase NrnA [Aerococcaceae bacterium zg-A91]MBS4457087.1 bifunctional oligoribonuclease/PAP phosphatase NrnA [Aerococcaceae bacterium zg-BR33]QQA37891.1 bifunctional oligoribonuclease/PAP phosphatase NrnA [Aerococcaceae bacterium zg-1292]
MYLSTEQMNAFYQLLKQYERIIIHRHKRPDPDAIGSQLGLKYLIEGAYPQKKVLAAGTTTQGLAWLGEMDKVSVEDYQDALVIVVDTANTERIDGDHYDKGAALIKIDHHPDVEQYGDLQIVYPQASSCSELLTAMTQVLQHRLPLNQRAARLLYTGIVGDTGRFLYSSTSAMTHQMTSRLLEQGINAFEINDTFQLTTLEELKFQAFAYDHLVVDPSGMAYLRIDRSHLAEYGITEEQTNGIVNIASRLKGVYCWVTFVEQEGEDFFYRCRIRSKGPVINGIAANHHGGGHPMASGANAYSEEEIQTIISEMKAAAMNYVALKA